MVFSKLTRKSFEDMALGARSDVPVIIEDGRLGLWTHWADEHVQVEAYRGNALECIQVPWDNLVHTPMGVVIGLKGAVRDAHAGLANVPIAWTETPG